MMTVACSVVIHAFGPQVDLPSLQRTAFHRWLWIRLESWTMLLLILVPPALVVLLVVWARASLIQFFRIGFTNFMVPHLALGA